jgi:site-specific DNA recombinase
MKPAIVYARVSSKDQEKEGYSIPAQLKLLREYALRNDLQILREFIDVESAKTAGRQQFGEMVRFFKNGSSCKTLIVEKTDRLYPNFRDYLTLEDLDVEIHLPKEGQIISKEAKSQAKLIHGIQVVMARNYIDNLREEVRKGMREKADQGIYPSRPPLGYLNNKLHHTIEVDPAKAPLAKRMFELYATGKYSHSSLRTKLKEEFGQNLAKGYLGKLLRNPFYTGLFIWEGKTYKGTHTPLVTIDQFEQEQSLSGGYNKPKYGKRDFAFRGLLKCAYDNCLITAELKKNKYTYYRCTGYRGKCQLPYFREEEIGDRLGQILKDIFIPDEILAQLEKLLLGDKVRLDDQRKEQRQRLELRLASVRSRLERAYLDKLDSKITEEFWSRHSAEWQREEQQILLAIEGLEQASPDRILDGVKILELANKAYFLYVKQTPAEKAKLLRMVLSNCTIDAASLYPTYRKPFDLIFQQAQNKGWRARRGSNSRPSAS